MAFYVYILLCADGTLYSGSTTDIQKRLIQHNTHKSGAHYTKIRRPVVLKYQEVYETFHEARVRENQIKHLTREQKQKLVANQS